MSRVEALLDLCLSASAAALSGEGPVAVVHSGQHHFPLLDQTCTLAWLQRRPTLLADFRASPTGLPAPRQRFGLPEALEAAVEVLCRSSLVLLALPELPSAAEVEADAALARALPAAKGREWLVYGPAASPSWSVGWAAALLPQLRPLVAPPGMRMAASAGALTALGSLGWSAALPTPEGLRRAAAALAPQLGAQWVVGAPQAKPRLCVRPPAASCIGAHGEGTRLLIGVRGRALFGPRGTASLLLPWEACAGVRMLISNIRGRIDGLLIAHGERELAPAMISYTAQGALVQVDFGPPVPESSRWLHLGLPRAAWPPQGCCELSAVEFTAELLA